MASGSGDASTPRMVEGESGSESPSREAAVEDQEEGEEETESSHFDLECPCSLQAAARAMKSSMSDAELGAIR
eukprot:14560799-Alexandrium_andersonii.AAC.1